MTRPLCIRNLKVQAFRGIPESVELDLSAAVTLLYAPNGTGKSTVCDAAEWLLTGHVERVHVRRRSEESQLRCVFSKDALGTKVSGEIGIGDKFVTLERTLEKWRIREPQGHLHDARENDVLALLAPTGASEDTHHKAAGPARRTWLRGTRFLSGETLAVLLDDEPNLLEARARIFADLLGVRHLLDDETALRRFADEIRPFVNATRASLEEQRGEEGRLRREIILTERPNQPAMRAGMELGRAYQLLGEPAPKEEAADNPMEWLRMQLAALAGLLARRGAALENLQAAQEKVQAGWAERFVVEGRLEKERHSQQELAAALDAAQLRLQQQRERAAQAQAEMVGLQERLEELGRIRRELPPMIQTLVLSRPSVTPNARADGSLGELGGLVDEAAWTVEGRARLTRSVDALRRRLNDSTAGYRRMLEVRAQLEAMGSIPSAEELARERAAAQSAGTALLEARQRYDNAAGPVDQLRDAARRVLTQLGDDCVCPACGHNWDTHERLASALNRAGDSAPEGLRQLADGLSRAEAEATAAGERVRTLEKQVSSARGLSEELLALEQKWRGFQADLSAVNVPNETPEDASGGLSHMTQRLAFAESIVGLQAALRRLQALLDRPMPETKLTDLERRCLGELADRERACRHELSTASTTLAELRNNDAVLEAARERAERELAAVRVRVQRDSQLLEGLRDAWRHVAGEAEWTDERFAAGTKRIADEAARLSAAKTHLQAVAAEVERSALRAELTRNEELRKDSERRLGGLGRYQDAADRAAGVLQRYREEYGRRQLEGLRTIVSSLFARMQANAIIDQILTLDQLRWLAEAGDKQLDPRAHFSQGQRQDLALAIFLARARALGGTFFLDEPISHLDDLNRVALLDILRVLAVDAAARVNLVISTASRSLVLHLVEKFMHVEVSRAGKENVVPLRVIELDGNARFGVRVADVRQVGAGV